MIICAAIKITQNILSQDLVVCGRRHGDCYRIVEELEAVWKENISASEGFVDHNGNFLNREDALQHAKTCGQLTQTTLWYKEDNGDVELYSEDLY